MRTFSFLPAAAQLDKIRPSAIADSCQGRYHSHSGGSSPLGLKCGLLLMEACFDVVSGTFGDVGDWSYEHIVFLGGGRRGESFVWECQIANAFFYHFSIINTQFPYNFKDQQTSSTLVPQFYEIAASINGQNGVYDR
jgi:hypothetical protein